MAKVEIKNIDIRQVDSIESLKLYGSYLAVKKHIEDRVGFKLGVKGWKDLYMRVSTIKSYIISNPDEIRSILARHKLKSAKESIYQALAVRIPARDLSELSSKIERLVAFFQPSSLSPHERYERNKRRNFINSSKLEGIEIPNDPCNQSLEEIINKYKASNCG